MLTYKVEILIIWDSYMSWVFLGNIVGAVVSQILILFWIIHVRKKMIRVKTIYTFYALLFTMLVVFSGSIIRLSIMLGLYSRGV